MQISQREFCDNPNLYMDINDFAELFQKIKFDINDEELNYFFKIGNKNNEEGYILIKLFFQNIANIDWRENTIVENALTTEYVDFKKINNEFKVLYDDVIQAKFYN